MQEVRYGEGLRLLWGAQELDQDLKRCWGSGAAYCHCSMPLAALGVHNPSFSCEQDIQVSRDLCYLGEYLFCLQGTMM